MSDSMCIVIRRAPYGTIHAAEAIRHVNGALGSGLETVVVLVEDGVYFARDGQEAKDAGWTSLSDVVKQTREGRRGDMVEFCVHDGSVLSRGIEPQDVMEGFEIVSGDDIADIVAESRGVMLF
ncbi:MAG: DsrE family protein [bacterium]